MSGVMRRLRSRVGWIAAVCCEPHPLQPVVWLSVAFVRHDPVLHIRRPRCCSRLQITFRLEPIVPIKTVSSTSRLPICVCALGDVDGVFLLKYKEEIVSVKVLEPFVPWDLPERCEARKVESDTDAHVVHVPPGRPADGSFARRRVCVVLRSPAGDVRVVARRDGLNTWAIPRRRDDQCQPTGVAGCGVLGHGPLFCKIDVGAVVLRSMRTLSKSRRNSRASVSAGLWGTPFIEQSHKFVGDGGGGSTTFASRSSQRHMKPFRRSAPSSRGLRYGIGRSNALDAMAMVLRGARNMSAAGRILVHSMVVASS